MCLAQSHFHDEEILSWFMSWNTWVHVQPCLQLTHVADKPRLATASLTHDDHWYATSMYVQSGNQQKGSTCKHVTTSRRTLYIWVPKSHLDGQHLYQVVKGKSIWGIRINHFKVEVIWFQCTAALQHTVKFPQYHYPRAFCTQETEEVKTSVQ